MTYHNTEKRPVVPDLHHSRRALKRAAWTFNNKEMRMLGELLRQLFPAIGRFIAYHGAKLLGRAPVPSPPKAPAADPPSQLRTSIATPASINALNGNVRLNPEYVRDVDWPTHRSNNVPAELAEHPLYRLWATIPGGHKWNHYFTIYEAIFAPVRTKSLRILEIGIFHGSSVKLWRKYFAHPGTVIVGIDIMASCMEFDAPRNGIHVRIGSQADAEFLREVTEEFGPFDLIIDDGSHQSSHIIASFNNLYMSALKDGGIYFVEDIHANYWHPWRDSRMSFLDVCKELLEHMHAHYSAAGPEAFLVLEAADQPNHSLKVPLIATMIEEMRFFDSIVTIYKTRRAHVPYYVRTAE